ncbi:MAG: hypothetical protein SF028_12245 [Candidatus Sumerlaeia bacterium]|nr:hypothetical protein [Candidatus Sumerlaeia bacterium]
MRKSFALSLAVAGIVALGNTASAQLVYESNFTNLTVGELNGQGGWTFSGTNTTPVINVATTDVNYPGLAAQGGDRSLTMVAGGQDVGASFTLVPATDGTALYASFVFEVTDQVAFAQVDAPATNPAQSNTDDDYFAHFTEGTLASGTGFRGRVFIDKGATGFYLGIRNTTGDPAVYAPTEYAFGTPTFLVLKMNFVAGNDTAEIFVNQIGASEPASPDAEDTVNAVAFADIGRIGFRQDSGAETPFIRIDRVRVASSWSAVVQGASSVETWNLM